MAAGTEEARALTDVTNAITDAGFTEPGFAVNFVHSGDAHFKGTTWAEWRIGGIEPRNPEEGYRGYCDRRWGMVFIRRFGEAEPYIHSLLIHEILHARGYDHGLEMKAAEERVWDQM
jgi:hypothetical protein